MNPTLVVFRKEKDVNEVVALFPATPYDLNGQYCVCYAHVGQHGSADPDAVINSSEPATPDEYRPLAEELQRIGYNLKIVQRVSQRIHDMRRKAAKE